MRHSEEAFCSQKDITAWRDRGFDVYLNSSVQREAKGARITIENDYVSLLAADALEVAEALYDAVKVTAGNRALALVDPGSSSSAMKKRLVGSRPASYVAEAEFTSVDVSGDFITADTDGVVWMAVATTDDGGIEFVFEASCYSFAMEDAIWFADSLRRAVGCEPIDVFEAIRKG